MTDLKNFYKQPLGQVVRRLLLHRIRARTRGLSGQTVIGLGFATPYLGIFRSEARHVAALMPAAQGALVWPAANAVATTLVDEERLPLADNSVDLLLAVHCLEAAERVKPLLRELWRVLRPEGRLILIVPNRTSIWARFDHTPFGHGRPFSRRQLQRLLEEQFFATDSITNALHFPPVSWTFILRSATAFERSGAWITPGIGGVLLVEARKELTQPIGGSRQALGQGVFAPVTRPIMPKDSTSKADGPSSSAAAQHEDRALAKQIMDE